MLDVLRAFSKIYTRSAAGRSGGGKDYVIDYETFLRKAGLDDGDEREIAEIHLQLAEGKSEGHFSIDRDPLTGDPLLIRLKLDGGEAWLFSELDETAPSEGRAEFATFFNEAESGSVPDRWAEPWRNWFSGLAARALTGGSIQPFKRDDAEGNAALLKALTGILNWQGESLVRYASAAICGDSKTLQLLEQRLRPALQAITGQTSLEAFGIFRKPRSVIFHGPLVIRYPEAVIDYSPHPAPVALSEGNLIVAEGVATTAALCLTVENEDVFHELARRNPGILLVQTSFAGSAALRFLRMLPAGLSFHHFGDSDPAGSDILRDLRERAGRPIQPLLMEPRPKPASHPLSAHDRKILGRLLEMELIHDLHEDLSRMLASGEKGEFEQEFIPISEVLQAIDRVRRK